MSTPPDSHFLIFAPDVPNAQREKYKPQHMEYNGPLFQSGYIVSGGGLLPDGKIATDADVLENLVGSFIIVKADSKAQVLETLKGDPFYSSGEVWDHEKLQITPIFLVGGGPKAK
ncbi:hypothetical protein L226DRAFT_537303 [Lentinus tigrinus ALCF2SS1-7]|uniref:YCII-related domain-containing protein n=1 Tax=Lentinus tigrinus ALCF2SS1-6 TaxID=1328759 RepID=A0A5C2S3R1_9APHY|nr:hypothetical protein L227DRAFT_551218 [Lentinus tigrinus ALCF2SS1-6]RPD72172.1 hypothetical protein L226DRAFT_537303 [Lentinus tigrinus ALCF2SS1-7]